MGLFEGKTPTERNKMIVAAVLGVIALASLWFAFGPSLSGGPKTTVTVTGTPTPTPRTVPGTATRVEVALPSMQDQQFVYETTPVSYRGPVSAPDAGRNIFAFYEPPPPCDPKKPGDCPTPPPPPPRPIPTPSPVPSPPIMLAYANPQSVYAGSRGFRLEIGGDKIPGDASIFFNQTPLPTTFISPQRVVADVPANMIAQEGSRQILLQSPDGKYSNPVFITVAAPPKPGYQYIGMKGGARYNNDTAYLIETGKTAPFGARLNDVLGGRFRLVNISRAEVVFEDTQLGFRHPIPMVAAVSGTGASGTSGQPVSPGIQPFDPTTMKGIPGIPDNIPRYVPPPPQAPRPVDKQKQDVDDAADDGKPYE
jgi:hypothetical protein